MWLTGSVNIERHQRFDRNPGGWLGSPIPYNATPLIITPWAFAYAALRSSVTGLPIGLPGTVAGIGFSTAALAFLDRDPALHCLRLSPHFPILKDFIGTTIKGVIGAAITYLDMMDMGYIWRGHWEDCVAIVPAGPHPDFVFASLTNVCLADAKGTNRVPTTVGAYVKKEWTRQILPNAGVGLPFCAPTEGKVIGVAMAPPDGFHIQLAHGAFPAIPFGIPLPLASVQAAHFAYLFLLLGKPAWAEAIMADRQQNILMQFDDIQREQTIIDDRGYVYLSNSAFNLPYARHQWSMRIFCRVETLRAVFEKFFGNRMQLELPVFQPQNLFGAIERETDMTELILQSQDGVGALFQRRT